MRPESPPPRAASPDIPYIPLEPPRPRRLVRAPTQSCSDLRHRARLASAKTPSRSSLKPARPPAASPPSTPRSLPLPSPPRSPALRPALTHHRSLSFAVPYRSPPPSPTLAAAPPPVPPIPEFILNPEKLSSKSSPVIAPIQLHSSSPISTSSKSRLLKSSVAGGITCFNFFKLRNQPRHHAARAVHAL